MNRFLFIIAFLVIIDVFAFRSIYNQLVACSNLLKYFIYSFYWLIPVFLIVFSIIILGAANTEEFRINRFFLVITSVFVLFYLPKLFIVFFQIIEDIAKVFAWLITKIAKSDSFLHIKSGLFLKSFFIGKTGLLISVIPFIAVIYGISFGRFNFEVNHIPLYFNNLPKAYNGFKIVQFSDFHSGSLIDQQTTFKDAFDLINKQNPDIIVFTGDIVNNKSNELDDWINLLAQLKAKYGKFSILGNHDYGDYQHWTSDSAKSANLDLLKQYHKKMGFRLLLNEAHIFERDSQYIALLGVENWGEKPFPQYGKLDLALEQAKDVPFKILLSHDPTHWKHEVLGKTDIALTLSGHTHGMQVAITFGKYSWSPVSFKYPRWRGLYTENDQFLYVNIGLGYIGFPGRIGTNPEITLFELKSK
jgi:predicted MPP superfamily phosphohydrolase